MVLGGENVGCVRSRTCGNTGNNTSFRNTLYSATVSIEQGRNRPNEITGQEANFVKALTTVFRLSVILSWKA